MKFPPLTVKVNAASPAFLLVGEMLVSDGDGLFTARLTAFEVPPPGAALNTVIGNVPAFCTSAAVICAVSCVLLTKVVLRLLPLSRTTELPTKPVPFTVRINEASPTVLVVGEMLLRVGTGLLTARSIAVDVPPPGPGLNTVTGNVPAA